MTQTGVVGIALRVAVAAVGAAKTGQVAKRRAARCAAGCHECLDGPGGRLGIGGASPDERETAVFALERAEIGERPADRLCTGSDTAGTQRLDRGRRVVRVRGAARVPGPAAASVLGADEVADARSDGTIGRTQREDAPDRRVDERADPAVLAAKGFEAAHVCGRFLAERPQGEDAQRDLRRAGLRSGPQVLHGRSARVAACGDEAEDRPGRQRRVRGSARLGEAAVGLLVRGDIVGRRGCQGKRDRCDGELHAQTTSVRNRRA